MGRFDGVFYFTDQNYSITISRLINDGSGFFVCFLTAGVHEVSQPDRRPADRREVIGWLRDEASSAAMKRASTSRFQAVPMWRKSHTKSASVIPFFDAG